jgi:DNA repair exonuclease SbcCD nuclease subunit
VLIPGNHDAPRRWGVLAPLLQRFSVHCVAEVRRPDRGGVIELPACDGSMVAQVAALPWVTDRRIVSAREMMGLAEETSQVYAVCASWRDQATHHSARSSLRTLRDHA